jgi:hypothetical protein
MYVSLKEQYNSADVIFIGRVVEIFRITNVKIEYKYVFEVIKDYKGINTKDITIKTGSGGGDCGYRFNDGDIYLVYAYGDSEYTTSICTRTKHISNAALDLKFLDKIPGSLESTAIIGKLSLYVNNELSLYDLPPLKNFKFKLKTNNINHIVETDSNGIYYIGNLTSGNYQAMFEKELHLSLKNSFLSYPDIVISESDVNEYNLVLTNINKVEGILMDEKKLLIEKGKVELVPEKYFLDYENKSNYETYDCWSDENGRFIFENVPNGKYLLGINTVKEPRHLVPYPKLFYKDASDLSDATIIDLNEKSEFSNLLLKVIKTYKTYIINCTLKKTDGDFWNDASVTLCRKSKIGLWEPIEIGFRKNDKGEFYIKRIENIGGWLIIKPRTNQKYSEKGWRPKKVPPIEIEANKDYDSIEIIVELEKR